MSILAPFPLIHSGQVTPDTTNDKRVTTPACPLTCDCPDCDGEGRVYKSRYGGNDPDTWTIRCDTCAGDGEIVRFCDKARCDRHATELVTFADCTEPYCAAHAVEMRREAVEEALAALTSWNRSLAGYHMRLWLRSASGSAEMGEIGREIEADGLAEWFRLPRAEMVRVALDAAA